MTLLARPNAVAGNELQKLSTITVVAQYSDSFYLKNLNRSNFRAHCMRQNDVSFAKIRSCRMKLRQLTCFRCTVKAASESASQSDQPALAVWGLDTISSTTQCATDESLQIKRHFEDLIQGFKMRFWLHVSLLRCKCYWAVKFRRSTKLAAEPWACQLDSAEPASWTLPSLPAGPCRVCQLDPAEPAGRMSSAARISSAPTSKDCFPDFGTNLQDFFEKSSGDVYDK